MRGLTTSFHALHECTSTQAPRGDHEERIPATLPPLTTVARDILALPRLRVPLVGQVLASEVTCDSLHRSRFLPSWESDCVISYPPPRRRDPRSQRVPRGGSTKCPVEPPSPSSGWRRSVRARGDRHSQLQAVEGLPGEVRRSRGDTREGVSDRIIGRDTWHQGASQAPLWHAGPERVIQSSPLTRTSPAFISPRCYPCRFRQISAAMGKYAERPKQTHRDWTDHRYSS